MQFAITRVAVPRRANGPDPEPPLGVHEHESSGDRREHPLCRKSLNTSKLDLEATGPPQAGADAAVASPAEVAVAEADHNDRCGRHAGLMAATG